jgi:hypothetical protein
MLQRCRMGESVWVVRSGERSPIREGRSSDNDEVFLPRDPDRTEVDRLVEGNEPLVTRGGQPEEVEVGHLTGAEDRSGINHVLVEKRNGVRPELVVRSLSKRPQE